MPVARVPMRLVREILRLHLLEARSQVEISAHLKVGRTTVREYLQRLQKSGITSWDEIKEISEPEIEACLGFVYKPQARKESAMPDWLYVRNEMNKRHVTLALLWQEYRESHESTVTYGYTQFCEHYKRFVGKLSVVMRQSHVAGEKTFIDYSGDGLKLFNRETNEVRKLELFVAVLGASSFTYAEVTLTQTSRDWISSHARMVEFFGGTTEIWVPDNLKSGVIKADRYEPLLNRTYQDCGSHYGACIIPARANKPRDKAKVEAGVLVAQRWILARLRNHVFHSLTEANEAIAICLAIINDRKMRHLNKSRREIYKELEVAKLKPLPQLRFEYAEWRTATLNINYHITFDFHHYSAPYQLVKNELDVRATATTIEIFSKGKRVASHRRSIIVNGYTTEKMHMPKSHLEHLEWTPERVVRWSGELGEGVRLLVEKILSSRAHPQQGFNSALGIIRLERKYGRERLDVACSRALEIGASSYRFVNQMLKNNMDLNKSEEALETETENVQTETQLPLLGAENIRGSGYYH